MMNFTTLQAQFTAKNSSLDTQMMEEEEEEEEEEE
jgi:hypothetical protein